MKLAGNEIEFSNEKDLPFFDRYLDEVLYLFDKADADIIVFEDIDRFDDVAVFERLREINAILNGPKYPKREKPIRFVYLVKDDIFSTSDRVKFFDTIIPIVPIINSSNSYDKFIEGLERFNLIESIDNSLLRGVALHITDMRLVENICNEFSVYSNVLIDLNLDLNKLFALIVYKNIFPRDFSLLQQNKGYVYALFHSVQNYEQSMRKDLESTISTLENRIIKRSDEVARNIAELDCLFKNFYKYDPVFRSYRYSAEYEERRRNIEENDIPELRIRLVDTQSKLEAINNMRLHTLLQNSKTVDDIFGLKNKGNEISNFEYITKDSSFGLLRYLLMNGYIDETYPDYMTYFYGVSLGRADKNFVLGVLDDRPTDPNQILDKPELVATYISAEYCSKIQILNYSFVHYLLNCGDSKITAVFRYLSTTDNFKYIEEHSKIYPDDIRLLSGMICKYWEGFFQCCNSSDSLDEDIKQRIVFWIIADCSHDDLSRLNKNSVITNYLNRTSSILEIEYEFDKSRVISNLNVLGVKFGNIDINDKTSKKILETVYEANAYKVNFNNVCVMLSQFYGFDDTDDMDELTSRPLSLIFADMESNLAQYISSNLTAFLADWLLYCETCTDDEEIAIRILNADADNKEDYLNILKVRISHAELLTDVAILGHALEKGKIEYSAHNLIVLLKSSNTPKIKEATVEFINNSRTPIIVSEDDDITERNNFINVLIKNSQVNEEKLESIIRACDFHFESFSERQLPDNRICTLIHSGAICMNSPSYKHLKSYYSTSLLINFIHNNFDKYIDMIESDENCYYPEDVISVLSSDSFAVREQKKLLNMVVDHGYLKSLPIKDSSYREDIICEAISLGIINKEGFSVILNANSTPISGKIRNTIVRWAIKYWDDFIDRCSMYATEKICIELIKNPQLDIEKKKEIFMLHMDIFTDEKIIEILSLTGFDEISKCMEGSSNYVPITEENQKVLEVLQCRNIITFTNNSDENYIVNIADGKTVDNS